MTFRNKLLAVVALSAAAFAAGELFIRFFAPLDALVYRDTADDSLHFELLPGARGMKAGVPVVISAQGLLDDPVPAEKEPGERRVVVVGGHEAFGVGVPMERNFVRLLPEGLRVPDGRVRSVNLSMYSYGFAQKIALACSRAAQFRPDVVVLQVNDRTDTAALPPPALAAPRLKNFIRAHSALIRWIMEDGYRHRSPPSGEPGPTDDATAREGLSRLAECLAPTGARAVVMLLPPVDSTDAAPSLFRSGLRSGAKETGMPLFDLGATLRKLPLAERALIKGDKFLSPAAHRVLADELRRRIKPLLEKKAAPRPPRPSV